MSGHSFSVTQWDFPDTLSAVVLVETALYDLFVRIEDNAGNKKRFPTLDHSRKLSRGF